MLSCDLAHVYRIETYPRDFFRLVVVVGHREFCRAPNVVTAVLSMKSDPNF